jgi:hypothetical protein
MLVDFAHGSRFGTLALQVCAPLGEKRKKSQKTLSLAPFRESIMLNMHMINLKGYVIATVTCHMLTR